VAVFFPQAANYRDEYMFCSISLGHYTHEKSPIGSTWLSTIQYIEENKLLAKVQEDVVYVIRLSRFQEKFSPLRCSRYRSFGKYRIGKRQNKKEKRLPRPKR
jgi:hypothetical protein